MAGITLAEAQAKLATWLVAEDALATSQSYKMEDGRELTRADLRTIGERIAFWDATVKRLDTASSTMRVRRGVPRP